MIAPSHESSKQEQDKSNLDRWLKRLAMVIGIVMVALAGGLILLRSLQHDCPIDEEGELHAPDGKHAVVVARINCSAEFLGGIYPLLILRRSSGDPGVQIFISNFSPEVAWADSAHIVVTVKQAQVPMKSMRSAEGVAIRYELGPGLSEDEVAKENARIDRESKSSKSSRDAALKNYMEDFEKFKDWARTNIPGSYPAK